MAPAPFAGRAVGHPGPVLSGGLQHLPPRLRNRLDSPKAQRREIGIKPREEYEALHLARKLQATDERKDRHKIRAGAEGTISQAVQACGLRGSRYRGLAKTSLQHQLTGAAINLIRIEPCLTCKPHARTRTSPPAGLRPAA
ncbi:transposase [Streptomyces sp. Edi4]|uniref:transposase n=1 Tax=Streptomyces sp. Edi4 TaxID=3162527 RepID=UPI0033056092